MKESTTAKNTRITYLADILQRARIALTNSNLSLSFSERDTRRIVLTCLLYLRVCEERELVANTYADVLKNIKLKGRILFTLEATQNNESISVKEAILTLIDVRKDADWRDLIIYSFESLEYDVDNYFSSNINRGVRNANAKKKNHGIYYTPNDVVSFMTSSCIKKLEARMNYPSVIDCSCGSGVFLLYALEEFEKKYNVAHKIEESLQILKNCIWGVDISGAAIDCCKTAFFQYYIDRYYDAITCFDSVWATIDSCFFVGDGTNLQAVISHNRDLPPLFDCIIGNPPYVTKGKYDNLFIGFVDNMMRFSTKRGLSALILPLSICYAQGGEYAKLRERIQDDDATWDFLNYDRSPDSLFGDQVKTRNTIVFRDAISEKNAIRSSSLKRWTSEERNCLFDSVDLCDIAECKIANGVPKISGVGAIELFRALHDGASCPFDLLSKNGSSSASILINGTAYNWLCVYDHLPPSVDENGNSYLSGTTKAYAVEDEKAKYFCVALLSNRIAYWYWTAIGDGFHLNSSFLTEFHVGKANFTEKQFDKLCKLGREYSSVVRQYPTVSYNAGKKIVNYSHWEAMSIVKEIEMIILDALKISTDIGNRIEDWYDHQVHCNR